MSANGKEPKGTAEYHRQLVDSGVLGKLSRAALLVVNVYIRHADRDLYCHPGPTSISKKTGLTIRSVRRGNNELQRHGIITRSSERTASGKHTVASTYLSIPEMTPVTHVSPVTGVSLPRDRRVTVPVTHVSADPCHTCHPEEDSEEDKEEDKGSVCATHTPRLHAGLRGMVEAIQSHFSTKWVKKYGDRRYPESDDALESQVRKLISKVNGDLKFEDDDAEDECMCDCLNIIDRFLANDKPFYEGHLFKKLLRPDVLAENFRDERYPPPPKQTAADSAWQEVQR